jgi:hypothetical protein
MSVFGTVSNYLINYTHQSLQSSTKQVQQEFQQLGQDLQSGDLSAAQSDLATLEKLVPQSGSSASAQTNSNTANAFNQLSQDLQAGNLSAAQKDYSALQVNLQNPAAQSLGQRHRAAFASQTPQTTGIGYLTPQQTYGVIQQEWQQLHSTPLGSTGIGYLTPQQTYTFIQQEMQRLQANIQSNGGQNLSPAGSNSISVLG